MEQSRPVVIRRGQALDPRIFPTLQLRDHVDADSRWIGWSGWIRNEAGDVGGAEAQRAFREDVGEARMLGIGRFPTIILERIGGGRKVLTGWRPYEALAGELLALAPELGDVLSPDAASAG